MKTKTSEPGHTRFKPSVVVIISVAVLLLAAIFVLKTQHSPRNPDTNSANKSSFYWKDPVTRLMWQKQVPDKTMNWNEAVAYCKNSTTAGYKGWRLPGIDELRSLVRKCPATETNGPCNIKSTDCLESLCWDTACNGCPLDKGRKTDGMYLPDEINANCCCYWSATTVTSNKYDAWTISFNQARIDSNPKGYNNHVICVR